MNIRTLHSLLLILLCANSGAYAQTADTLIAKRNADIESRVKDGKIHSDSSYSVLTDSSKWAVYTFIACEFVCMGTTPINPKKGMLCNTPLEIKTSLSGTTLYINFKGYDDLLHKPW